MAKASPALASFNGGEYSDQMSARVDFEKYGIGCHLMQNFIPLVQGPAMRRPGTPHVAEVKDSTARTWLRKFEFSATQSFQIEFGGGYCRFYTNHAPVAPAGAGAYNNATAYNIGDMATSGGVTYYCIAATTGHAPPNVTYWYAMPAGIYEIPSPYASPDLTNSDGTFALSIEQSGDVLYIAAGAAGSGYQPYTLTRYSNSPTKWVFAPYAPIDGPFLDLNDDGSTVWTGATMIASATTGSVTITASANIFKPTDVGRLIRLDQDTYPIDPWVPGIHFGTGNSTRNGGKTYIAQNTAVSGTVPPTHLYGVAADGTGGVQWLYADSGYGVALITAYTSATQVTATIQTSQDVGLSRFPPAVTTNATTRWYLGAWSGSTEYPRAVTFFYERLFWAGKLRIWGSVPGKYTSHAQDIFGTVTTDSGIAVQLSAQDVNNIVWLSSANLLLIGTQGGEFGLGPISGSGALGPDNVRIARQSNRGCRAIKPANIGTSAVYVQRAGRKLYMMDYNFYIDRYDSTNQTKLAYHITAGGFVDIAFQSEPFQTIWCVRADGVLVGYTYDKEDQVTGWHRHTMGGNGIVECVCTNPAPDGNRDELWMIVRRTINGVTRRYVEYMAKHYESASDAQSSAFYVDSGITQSSAPTTSVTGLSHLEGQTVEVFADGGKQSTKVVTGGAITLDRAASVITVGLGYTSNLVTMRIEAGADIGTSQGKTKRIAQATVRLVDSLGGSIGMYGAELDEIQSNIAVTTLLDTPPAFYTDDVRMSFPGDWETDCQVQIQQTDPFPMTVAGLFPYMQGQEPQ